MDFPPFDVNRVSADVRLGLAVGDSVLPLAQIGRHWVMLRNAVDLPPGQMAEVVMVVEGNERRWPIRLPFGASVGDPDVFTEGVQN